METYSGKLDGEMREEDGLCAFPLLGRCWDLVL